MVSALEFRILATARDPVAPVLDQSPLSTDGKGLALTLGLLNCSSIPVAMLCRTLLQCLLSRMSATPVTHPAIICWLLVLWWMDWLQNRWGSLVLPQCPQCGSTSPAVAPSQLLHFGSPEYSVGRKWHCSHAVQILSRMCLIWMFFAMNTVGIEQEAVSLLTVSSLFPAGKQPHKALCLLLLRVRLQMFLLLSPWLSDSDTWHPTTIQPLNMSLCPHRAASAGLCF